MSDVDPGLAPAAGNGLLDRRLFLKAGAAGSAALLTAQAGGVEREVWMKAPGAPMSANGAASRFESHVERLDIESLPGTTGTGVS
ncbi:MAG: sulfane dehydrogenase subunit SoxC, partial [Gammaproteobacteria bacterium]